MTLYLLFLGAAALTVVSPGPGVLMTITNALRFGFKGTIGGIIGIAVGAFVVAGLSATAVGAVLAASAVAFTVMKVVGAAYLVYLGLRLWRAPPFCFGNQAAHDASIAKRFIEGLSLQLTNPKAIFFFLSLFPQFIDPAKNYAIQFGLLVFTYAMLVVLIHTLYALFANRARRWLTSESGSKLLNRISGATFLGFGIALATARRSGA